MKNKLFEPLLILTSAFGATATACAQQLPNIVLIFMDDMGYGDIGSFGASQYATPNIDQLAAAGMRFTNFYVAQAVSSASRAGLLTGCYPNRVGIQGALSPTAKTGLNPKEETIAEILKQRNYKTAAIGKWHLGHHQEFLPLQQGFDEYFGLPYSNDMWPVYYDNTRNIPPEYARKLNYPELPLIEGNKTIKEIKTIEEQAGLTTSYTHKAIEFIEKNKKNHFFLYMAHSMTHVPLAVSDKFKGKSEQGLFGDVMMEIDWSVGEIIKTLEKNGLTNKTLIIFTSDNGPWLSFGNHAGSTAGLREGKGTSYEGGQRVPCIMKWPDHIPQGTICNRIASTIDILPTLATITGCNLPKMKIDGINILPLLTGDKDANPRNTFLYYFRGNSLEAVRKGNWKLVFPHPGRSYVGFQPGKDGKPGGLDNDFSFSGGLYDLRRDPGERYDVSESYPEIVKDLEKIADEARQDLGDDLTNNRGKNRRESGKLSEQNI